MPLSPAGGNTGGSFSINSQGGVVVARPLDWETTSEYTLNVSATDGHHVVYTPVREGRVLESTGLETG